MATTCKQAGVTLPPSCPPTREIERSHRAGMAAPAAPADSALLVQLKTLLAGLVGR